MGLEKQTTRRWVLGGLIAAPAIIKVAGIMPVKVFDFSEHVATCDSIIWNADSVTFTSVTGSQVNLRGVTGAPFMPNGGNVTIARCDGDDFSFHRALREAYKQIHMRGHSYPT